MAGPAEADLDASGLSIAWFRHVPAYDSQTGLSEAIEMHSNASNVLPRLFVCVGMLSAWASAGAAVTAYIDETEYLSDLAGLGHTALQEGFEDDAVWGGVRGGIAGDSTAPSITHLGVTWTANNTISEVTTGSGPARTGDWGFYTLPHGDFANGIGDGFVGTSSRTLYGVGGWIETNTPPAGIALVLDADTVNRVDVDLGETCTSEENCVDNAILGTQHKFFGVIKTDGFGRFDFLETEFTPPDESKLIAADDFTFAVADVFPGDLNVDGFVGQTDLDIVLSAWGTGPPIDPRADPSGDGFVGQADLDTVLADWGQGTAPPAVPEPATLGTLALCGLALLRRKGKSREYRG